MKSLFILATMGFMGIIGCSSLENILPSSTPKNPQWQQLDSTPGKFTIQMPDQQTQKTTNPSSNLVIYEYTALHNNSVYSTSYSDFPKSLKESQIYQILSAFEDALKRSLIEGQIISQSPLNKNGSVCQEFMIMGKPDSSWKEDASKLGWQIKDQTIYLKGVHCIKRNHFVEAMVMSHSTDEIKGNGTHFLNSFTLK